MNSWLTWHESTCSRYGQRDDEKKTIIEQLEDTLNEVHQKESDLDASPGARGCGTAGASEGRLCSRASDTTWRHRALLDQSRCLQQALDDHSRVAD